MIALISLAMTGCATTKTEYVEVRPQCSVPPQPALPQIDGEALAIVLDDVYWALETREKRLTDWALEMRGMLRELCRAPGTETPAG